MKDKTDKSKSEKKNTLISHIDENIIVDTVIYEKQPQFIVSHRGDFGNSIKFQEDIELNGKKYLPLNINSSYIKNGSLLFPTYVVDYRSTDKLVNDIRDYIYKYVDISKNLLKIIPFYVLMTYVYDRFSEIPYLRTIGDYGSGKSRLLQTVGHICYNPIITNGGTSLSALFRMIEISKGTLVFDEADLQFSETTNDIIKLLNNGFAKGNPILRADGEDFEPKAYNVFGPKIIGGRFEFRDKAVESRCIVEIMKKTERKDLSLNLIDDFYAESISLRNKLYRFRYDYYDKIEIYQERIYEIEPRLNQILNPILSLMKQFGKDDDRKSVIDYFIKKQDDIKQDRKLSLEGIIFYIIKEELKKNTIITYQNILEKLKEYDGWYHNITPRKLGSILKQYEIKPDRKSCGFILDINTNSEKLEQIYKNFGLFGNDIEIIKEKKNNEIVDYAKEVFT